MLSEHLNRIKYIEEISLNAWPSHMIELYDGWLIRFSHNYTYRTNSVEQVGVSTIPLDEKIAYCEDIYRSFRTPCNFKINPLTPEGFEDMLEKRGYERHHEARVMSARLTEMTWPEPVQIGAPYELRGDMPSYMRFESDICVMLKPVITDEWINGLFHLNGTNDPVLRRIVPSMFRAIPKKTIAASVELEGHMAASGLAICDRTFVGIYAIYVAPYARRRGYARAVCAALLKQAMVEGAKEAYLQVVYGNDAARSLYRSLGLKDDYDYHFLSRSS